MEKQLQINDWYYAPVPSFPLKQTLKWLAGLLFLVLLAHWIFKPGILINILLIAGVLVIIFFKFVQPYLKAKARYDSRPSDKQIDDWLEEDLTAVVSQAAGKFDIDEDDPDELKAPTLVLCFPVGDACRDGFDNKTRWVEWGFHLLFFRVDCILYYHGLFDSANNKVTAESNERVFYKDIINPKVSRDGEQTIFELGGTSIRISFYPNFLPIHGKNRTSDVQFTARAIEKLMHSSKYKTS